MNRVELKTKAKLAIKKNYWRCFAVCFIVALLVEGTILFEVRDYSYNSSFETFSLYSIEGKSNSEIVNDFIMGFSSEVSTPKYNGFLGSLFNNISKSGSFLFGILNAANQFFFNDRVFASIIIVLGSLIGVFYWIFVAKVLEIGKKRFFLENSKYSKSRISRLLMPFKVQKNLNVSWVMLVKNFYQFLWTLTVIGGPIKFYAYRMVPYILAENPTVTAREAINLSKNMMNHHKWNAFCLDFSFIGYYILGIFSLNIINLFYTNLYKEATFAEYYMYLRENVTSDILTDNGLESNDKNLDEYPSENYFLQEYDSKGFLQRLDYNCSYSFSSYILLFFVFAFLGWIFEVLLSLFSNGLFVNRGALHGPWLPIYGFGGVTILFLLKKIRDRPVLLFFLTMILAGVIEYGTALYLETFNQMKWWDYTGFFLNIHGRVCLEGLLFFGVGGLVFVYILGPYFNRLFKKINDKLKVIVCIILVLIIACDFIYSGIYPNKGEGITTELSLKF